MAQSVTGASFSGNSMRTLRTEYWVSAGNGKRAHSPEYRIMEVSRGHICKIQQVQASGQTLILAAANKETKTISVAFSPQANYNDWLIAAGLRILVPTFEDRGVSRSQRGGSPTAVNFGFLDRSRYSFFQVVPHSCCTPRKKDSGTHFIAKVRKHHTPNECRGKNKTFRQFSLTQLSLVMKNAKQLLKTF
jgi:hypothetical protein